MMHNNRRRPHSSSRVFRFRSLIFGLTLLFLANGLPVQNGGRLVKASPSRARQEIAQAPQAGTLLISEFRLRGGGGATDEFIEIYNNSGVAHTVNSISGTGYSVATNTGVARCTIPNTTVIPAGGHYLCTNSAGYTLTSYPAGNGTTANGNATYVLDIPDNVGIALFNNNTGGASFTFGNRFDAVGPNTETNGLYLEGTGYPPLSATNGNYSFIRKFDPATGLPVDTDNNAADFLYVDPAGISLGAGQRLGAPGPQNLSSPLFLNGTYAALPLDASKATSTVANRVRDLTVDPGNNSTMGTLSIRRRFVNNTGANITRLRFRITDISTFPSPAFTADLRPRTSGLVVVAGIGDSATCLATGAPSTPPCTVSVQGTTLETPPAQPNGGGVNSSWSAGTVTSGTPIAMGASINLQFLMGVMQNGNYRLRIELEALPGGGALFQVSGTTSIANAVSDALNGVADYDGDGKTDISVFRPSAGTWFLLQSQAGFAGVSFGVATDKIVPADYDGDGKTDIAVYRPSTGVWFIINSSSGALAFTQFGVAEDLPTPADYDGDGRADLSVFRPSSGTWFRLNSSTGAFVQFPFGASGDKPAIGDYDGDGKSDLAVYRPSAGTWFRINSSNGSFTGVQFGISTDLITPGDFDGDGKTDLAVFRPSEGNWFRLNSGNGTFAGIQFGANGDNPTPGDYDLDGKEDISVFRPTDGTWYQLNSSNGAFVAQQFGANGDLPTPSAFRY